MTSSVPWKTNRLKCNHFDLCQNRGEDLGFDPPSPRRLSPRIRRNNFLGGQFASRPVLQQFWGWPPEKPFSKEVSHSMSTRWTPEPPVFCKCSYGAFLGGRKLYNLTRMDGMGWALFSGPMNLVIKPVTLRKGFKRQKNNRRLGSGSNLSSRKQLENESILYIIMNYQPPNLPKLYPNNARFFTGKSLKHTTITITF